MTMRPVLVAACLTIVASCKGDSAAPPPPVASVKITPESAVLTVGGNQQLSATTLDAKGKALSNRTVTWSSTNSAVATVSTTGLVTAVAVGGPITIVATSELQDGAAAITVVPPPVATVSVSPATTSLTPGATRQLAVTLRDAQSNVLTGRTVTWTTSDAAVAVVTSQGIVTAVAPGGPATITASSEGKTGTATVSVVTPVLTSITVSPNVAGVGVGATVVLTATAVDQNGIVIASPTVAWSTSDAAIATVSQAGVVTGVAAGGPVTITAASSGKSGTASITVSVDPCAASIPITIGQTLSGTLSSTDCAFDDGSFVDMYRLAVAASARVQIDVSSTAFDAYVILFEVQADGSLVAVAFDNDAGPGADARIVQTLAANTTYLIAANSLLDGRTGAYSVSVQTSTAIIADASSDSNSGAVLAGKLPRARLFAGHRLAAAPK